MHPQSGAFEIHHTAQDAFLAIKSMQVRSVIGRQYVQLVLLIEEMFIKYKNTSEQHIAIRRQRTISCASIDCTDIP